MSISKRTRFEVFKRDQFTCQYCGRKSPDVLLHVDHVHPRAEGGDDGMLNLVTSCVDCNLGKGAVKLSDDTAIEKQRRQLEELQERREQIDMMLEWQRSLANLEDDTIAEAAEFWCELAQWEKLTPHGMSSLGKSVRRHGLNDVLTAMRTAAAQYFRYTDVGELDSQSTEDAFRRIDGICATTKRMVEKPYLRDLYYIRKIAENRCGYFNKHEATQYLESAFSWGANPDELKDIARNASSWTRWRNDTVDYIIELKRRQGYGTDP